VGRTRFSLPNLLTAIVLSLAAAGSSSGDWIRDFGGDVSYDDNVSRSNREADERQDVAFRALAHLGRFDQLSDDLRLTLTADFSGEAWERYQDFNNATAAGTASLRYRFGLGAWAPFVRVEGSAGYASFEQSLQDGGRYRSGVTFGKRLTERLSIAASYHFDDNESRVRVFNQQAHHFSLAGSFDLSETTQITAGYELREGEVISYAVPPRPDMVALANALRPVDTFGGNYVAYNLDATTHAFSVGVSQAFTRFLALNLRYERLETSRAHLYYINNIFNASLHASF
jgi:hypothetical protein